MFTCILCIYIELKEAVLNCDQQIIDVAELDAIWDIKSWLSPHINTPHGHTNPQQFFCFNMGKVERQKCTIGIGVQTPGCHCLHNTVWCS